MLPGPTEGLGWWECSSRFLPSPLQKHGGWTSSETGYHPQPSAQEGPAQRSPEDTPRSHGAAWRVQGSYPQSVQSPPFPRQLSYAPSWCQGSLGRGHVTQVAASPPELANVQGSHGSQENRQDPGTLCCPARGVG